MYTFMLRVGNLIQKSVKYPNSRVLGPKVHTLNGFWTLKPYYLGTWTLRELDYLKRHGT